MPDQFGGESLLIPIEDICKDDKSLWGTLVVHLYIDNIPLVHFSLFIIKEEELERVHQTQFTVQCSVGLKLLLFTLFVP